MSRTQAILGGVLLLQVLLILVFRSPFSGASASSAAQPLLPVLEAISPNRLEIRGADDEHITLKKNGEDWGVEEIGGFPADRTKVDGLLDDLKALEVRRPVVSSSRYHSTFKVEDDDNEARLRLWDETGDEPDVDLIVGDSPNYRATHVRLAGEDRVYEVRGLAPYDVRPDKGNWIDKKLVAAAADQVIALSLTNEAGKIELEKLEGAWKVRSPEGQDADVDQEKVASLVRAATSIRLAAAVGPLDAEAQGLSEPAVTVVLRWAPDGVEPQPGESVADARELTVRIGSKVEDDDSQRYITRSGLDFTGTVWDSSVTRLLEEKLDGLR